MGSPSTQRLCFVDGVGRLSMHGLAGSRRWKVAIVGWPWSDRDDSSSSCGGAVLLRDEVRGEWRSFFDEHCITDLCLDGEGLIVRATGLRPRDCQKFRV